MALCSSRCRLFVAGLFVACALVGAITSAIPAESDTDSLAGVEKIRKALNQTVNMAFVDMSLKESIANLREQTKLNIILDEQVVSPDMMDSSTKTTNLRRVRLRSGLHTLLGQYNLAYVILGDVLLITQKEAVVDRQLQQLVNVDLTNVSVAAALKKLARDTATNLVIDPRENAQTPLSMQLEEVPLEMAVRTMAEAVSLKPVLIGNVLFVTNQVRANELQADPDTKSPAALRKMLEDETYMLVPGDQGGAKFVPRPPPDFGLGGSAGGLGCIDTLRTQPGLAGLTWRNAECRRGHR